MTKTCQNPRTRRSTGILRAIVAGERDPQKLAVLRNYRCQKDEAEITKALTGTRYAEHLFVLRQVLERYDFYTCQIEACDAEIERTYAAVHPDWPNPAPDDQNPLLANKRGSNSKSHLQRKAARPDFTLTLARAVS